ncbi:hypothetical protein Esi_0037_0079 [Ectocarpus siliculosus]|uniref:Uncharacterized protein n=1 Tax=Ectocarpus siliculosus TaxID=2880 RepID=D8LLN0_ECTSI|nr:hypothetical protein Esi_0037_0079 [Ectocarpus siliculosus]|eukprot:CBN74661.1 hypothetical protein Esi_0037_0079 [Ectocarpus siliculosus]
MAQGPAGNGFSSFKGDSDNKHGADKILTAGPSTWQSAQTNLVHELRCLVHARDMALAEQRARHVKESILVREQQRTLATDDPVFIGKTAKLLRAADDVAGGPAINSPLSVSPVTSRPASPILTAANQNAVDHSLEDSTCCAKRGDGLSSERDTMADTSKPPDTDDLTDSNNGNGTTLAFTGCRGGTANDNNWESRKGSPPSPSIIAAKSNEESTARTCSRCVKLQHELVTALTDRTLVEAELVSLRRASSWVDTGWEGESAGGAVDRKELGDLHTGGPGGTVRVVDDAENNAPRSPCEELGNNDQGLDLHVEIERLESLVSRADQGAPLSDLDAIAVDSEGLQMQELSRRRLLRLGAEADLRAARAKLDMLLPTATMPAPTPDMAKGDTERQGAGVTPLQQNGSIHRDVIQEETGSGAGQHCDTKQTSKKGGEFPPTNAVPPKGGQGSSAIGRGRRGRGRSSGGLQSERGAVSNREKLSGRVQGVAGPPKQALGSRTADEGTTTTRKATPRTQIEDGRHPSQKDAGPKARLTKGSGKKTGGPTNDRQKIVVVEKEGQEKLRNSPPQPDTSRPHERDDPNKVTVNDNAKRLSVSLVEGQLQGEGEASKSSLTKDGNQAPGGDETTIREAESSLTGGNGCAKADPTVGIVANASEPPPPTVPTEVKNDVGDGKRGAMTPTKHGRAKGTTKQDRGKAARSSPSKLTKGAVVRKPPNRLTGEKAKTKSASTAESAAPTRSLTATEEQQFSRETATEDATGSSLPTSAPVDPGVTVEEMEDVQKQEGRAEKHGDSLCGTQEELTCLDTTHKTAGDEGVEQDVRARGPIVNEEGVDIPATGASARRESISQEKRKLAGPADGGEAGDNLVTEDGDGTIEGYCGGGAVVVSEDADPGRTVGGADLHLRGVVDLAEVLRVEVDKLRLEKAELEDTIAQLNVAAAQLYLVEYEQMKAKCRQLKRVVFGPASRPANAESAYGHSCQEVMHRLKVIGVKFFRRRIGGVMGEKFFPDGLARALTLIGRPRMTQGSQTAPVDRLGPLSRNGGSPGLPRSRDVHVQVAGGIDVEDEPLMEQQVYGLLGKLDLLLKRREDVLWAYHREAEEGAREARALLASAAAQHHPGQAWGVSRPPNVRQLIGGREGPAGAPRPAINPTNLLFTAAVVLDSVAAAAAGPTPEPTVSSAPTPEKIPSASGGSESRRQRYSPAEKALLELADEVVAALDVEQRRSDASAERRRLAVDRHNNSGDSRFQALGRPPLGVPPLIWAMEIHLVGKLARAFRTAVEARGFEREVEDANLVAAVTLGRSSPPSSNGGKNDSGPPWHLEHRMLSVLRGDEEEERERLQRARREFENTESCTMAANNQREQQRFGWGADTYSPRRIYRPMTGNVGTDEGQPKYGSSPTTSPRRKEGLARGQQSRPDSTKGRTGVRDGRHASTFNRPGTMARGSTFESKAKQQCSSSRTVDGNTRDLQNQDQREQQRQDSAAVARVEAAVFDTVRPSRLHPRPGSASFEGRSGRVGFYEGCSTLAATERLRPQSARLPEAHDKFLGEGGRTTVGGHTGASHAMPSDAHRSGRRAFEGNSTSGPNGEERPVRTTMTTVALTANTTARRPASAGGRVVDTRTWSSNSNVVEAGTGVFRCRPNKTTRAAVRFEASATEGGVSSSQLVPTHPGAVPQFLLRKERELLEAHRHKQAAVNGRFEVVPDQGDDIGGCGDEGVSGYAAGGSGGDIKSDRRVMNASEISDRWGREIGDTLEQGGDGGSGAYGGRVLLSSVRLEDSMDGEGLMPDAGEQAFFDAWKPTGYDIDLSRYD